MNRFQLWSLRRLLKIIVTHGRVELLFRELRQEYKYRWYEDSDPTREADLLHSWEASKL